MSLTRSRYCSSSVLCIGCEAGPDGVPVPRGSLCGETVLVYTVSCFGVILALLGLIDMNLGV